MSETTSATFDRELGTTLSPKFDRDGLITAIAQDAESREILMVAFMNEHAFRKTIELREAVYWSRSRQKLWHKGEESGLVQKVREIRVDCDQDAIVLLVDVVGGGACHNGYRSCFYRSVDLGGAAETSLVINDTPKVFDPASVYRKK